MTRGEMIGLSDELLLSAFGSPFAENPFTPHKLLDTAADEVCRKTGCFYDVQATAFIAEQAVYCAPTIYRNKQVYALDKDGQVYEMIVRTPSEMTREFGAEWRDWKADDAPRYLVWEGTTRVRVAPVPTEDRAGALVFEGFATTTSQITGSAAHLWPLDTDECPLPEDGHLAAVLKLNVLRCMQYLGKIPEAPLKMAAYEKEYKSAWGDLARNAAGRYTGLRTGPAFARYL